MKSWLKKNMLMLCSAFLMLSGYYHFGSYSLIFFGEPEFPVEE